MVLGLRPVAARVGLTDPELTLVGDGFANPEIQLPSTAVVGAVAVKQKLMFALFVPLVTVPFRVAVVPAIEVAGSVETVGGLVPLA